MPELVIRPAVAADEPQWRPLWDAYNRFYDREPREDVTQHTWQSILDPDTPVHCIVAEYNGTILGIAHCVIHENTSQLTPSCFLQDMIVSEHARGNGIGGHLIEYLIDEMKAQNWSRLYWNTKETNYRARGLYDKFTPHSGFVRYVINNPNL